MQRWRKTAPIPARIVFGLYTSAQSPVRITVSIPSAFAVRRIVPRFPGSCIVSRTSVLPGASGAQEGGFYIFFQHVFPADKLVGALLLWRFFTYYFTMIIGVAAVIFDSAWSMRHAAGEKAVSAEQEGEEGT